VQLQYGGIVVCMNRLEKMHVAYYVGDADASLKDAFALLALSRRRIKISLLSDSDNPSKNANILSMQLASPY